MKTSFVFVLLLFILFAGYVLLAYAMDETYDPSRPQTSNSISESRQLGAFVRRLEPENKQIVVAGVVVKIKEAWIEQAWKYVNNSLFDRILGRHPTTIIVSKSLLIRLGGDTLPKSYMRDWAFTLKTGTTGRVNEVVQIWIEDEADPVEKAFIVKYPVPYAANEGVIVDSIILK